MPNNNNKKITLTLLFSIAFLLFVSIVFYDGLEQPTDSPAPQNQADEQSTLATEWDWQSAQSHVEQLQQTAHLPSDLPFNAQSVYDALQAVKVDDDGNILLDHDALISLDEALERIHNKLDPERLLLLQELIINSLPAPIGQQTAEIVGQYHAYLQAKEEFSRINEELSENQENDSVEAVENDQALYEELQALREQHLGSENTAKLFRVTDANAEYMFESMKLGFDNQLTEEQIIERREQIQQQHIAQSVNIRDWPARYQAFISAKQAIMSASLDDEEKRKQVAELLAQHFNPAEIDRISYLGLGTI